MAQQFKDLRPTHQVMNAYPASAHRTDALRNPPPGEIGGTGAAPTTIGALLDSCITEINKSNKNVGQIAQLAW